LSRHDLLQNLLLSLFFPHYTSVYYSEVTMDYYPMIQAVITGSDSFIKPYEL